MAFAVDRMVCTACPSDAIAVVFVDGGNNMAHVVCFEEGIHLLVEVFCTLIGTKCLGMGPEFGDQAFVGVNEVILV